MKDCLIIGPTTALHYNDAYPLLVSKELYAINHHITRTYDEHKTRVDMIWFSTLPLKREKLQLTKHYSPTEYPSYSNYDAIESSSKDIPVDYQGLIAVPITFFKYYDYLPYEVLEKRGDLVQNGKQMFARLIIRRKK